jgi:ATP-binding cassette subfamily B protein
LVRQARFSYVSEKEVLREASLVVPAGWKAAVAGRTGSGKTTLLQLVAGLYPASAGTVLIHGRDPYRLPPQERRRLIGMVPQTVTLFHGSILENVTLRDTDISEKDVEWALEQVGLLADIRKLPDSLHTLLGEGEAKLSFGQNQLISLARAIVTNPPVLLLDELTSGLDALTEKQVLEAIRTISGGRTILTISHRLSGLLDAQTVHIMEHGRIVESGAPEVLAEREGWYARYRRLEDHGWQM